MKKRYIGFLIVGIFFMMENPKAVTVVSGNVSSPVGIIQSYVGEKIPENYLEANGQELSRSEYKELFTVIGTAYGAGDGKTTFNLPNLNGKVPVGMDASQGEFNALGKTGGTKTETLTINQMPSHTHEFVGDSHSHTFTGSEVTTTSSGAHTHPIPKLSGTTDSKGEHTHNINSNTKIQAMAVNIAANKSRALTNNGGDQWAGYNYGQTNQVVSAGEHTHTVTINAGTSGLSGAHTHTATASGTNSSTKVSGTNNETGGSKSHTNLQPYITMKYVIRYQ